MTTRFTTLLAVVAAALPHAAALAAEEQGAHPELLAKPETAVPAMLAAIIMFLTLLFLLKKTAWGPILNGLQAREVKIRSEIEAAENARAQANAALDEYQKELAKARAEANDMIAKAREEAQRVAQELRSANETELTAMKDKARQDIEAATRTALAEIYNQYASVATLAAAKILERDISPADHTALIDASLREFQSLKRG